ncbi:hypothetical protein TSAR_009705 [Trichomalopsis sarcophagae]|uniref:Uncharacterized protein n=1 Tax=Trichomalopsis sarcophagae TaxID=543379 RepID=A0A232EK85_9HYME|nr:hypothetical protein TSAR_009705 [Trichomalopsis sarcophagae]
MAEEVTHARVKYLTDEYVEIIPIDNIIEFENNKPKHKKDFDPKKVYKAKYQDEKNPKELILKVQIADLACGLYEVEELENTRPKFAKLFAGDIPSTSYDNETNSEQSDEREITEQESDVQQSQKIKNTKKKKIVNERGRSILNHLRKPRHSLTFHDSFDELDETDPLAFSTLLNNNSDAGTPEGQTHNNEPVVGANGQRNAEDVHNQSNAEEDLQNQPNAEENVHNQPNAGDVDNERIPVEENYSLNNKFLSQFIIDSIDYYKSREGHGYEERNARYKPVNDTGELYLGEGRTVRPDVWRMLQTEKPNVFLREIIMKLWTARDLANRALDLKRVHVRIPNRSPVYSMISWNVKEDIHLRKGQNFKRLNLYFISKNQRFTKSRKRTKRSKKTYQK